MFRVLGSECMESGVIGCRVQVEDSELTGLWLAGNEGMV